MNAAHLATESLERFGDYTAYHFEGRDYSCVGQLDYAARIATVLAEHGVGVDDPVVLITPNCPDVLAGFQAVWRLGGIIMPLTPQLTASEIAYALNHSEARVVFTVPELAEKVAAASAEAPGVKHILSLGESEVDGVVDIADAVANAVPHNAIAQRSDDDVAFLLYTSGTTGNPKGVLLTHGNIVANHRAVASLGRLVERSWTILTLPLSHSYGVLMMNLCYLMGCSAVMFRKFDPVAVLEAIQDFRVTRFAMVPTMLVRMLRCENLSDYDLSSVQIVHSGAAPLPNEVRIQFEETFGCKVFDNYGQSESSPSLAGYDQSERIRPGSVGHALPGVKLSIQDEDGALLGPNEIGEICAQGPNVMKGYLKNEEATAQALRGGWLHTGDVGYLDADGYLFITDRMKDLIIKAGENISPREIEEVLYTHPAIDECAVVGMPDPEYGETICAVVSFKNGQIADPDTLADHAAQTLTKFKLPSRWIFRDALPKNANGKLDRKVLRADLANK